MHELADREVVDGLGRRDQGDAALAEIGHHDGVVEPVAGHAGELVDDDHVDVTRGTNSSQHLLEGDPLGHLGGGLAGPDVLIDHGQAELLGLALARNPLGRYGDAFGVVVGVDLPCGGDTQIDDGPVPGSAETVPAADAEIGVMSSSSLDRSSNVSA